ncbi:MazG-like family protein [Actinomadura violacea]|uniref:MazG-like family protein n=1 Tax=Actinomadura violacea TaxID=2819934 RepID=A0ABS3S839_9ACTN|nr:MazG-like family protein [Actinomadura violacea]MBO2464928.1 MazG-like family protein [Actinomadura violacea]
MTTAERAEPCHDFWADTARIRSGYLVEVPTQTLVLKIAEEVGEVAEAYIGMTGGNPRKGIHKTRVDVLDELADVMLTVAVAMADLAGGVDEAEAHMARRLEIVSARDVAAPPSGADTVGGPGPASSCAPPPAATC